MFIKFIKIIVKTMIINLTQIMVKLNFNVNAFTQSLSLFKENTP